MPPKIPGVWRLAPKEHVMHFLTIHEGIQKCLFESVVDKI